MTYTAAVITVSDKCSRGERTDTSGPSLVRLLTGEDWNVVHTALVPDEADQIAAELRRCADEIGAALVLTTGGTGFTQRDVTPEATLPLLDKLAPGIPEAMRWQSMQVTPFGCLSRGVAGVRKNTLIINLPGSEKASRENLLSVLPALRHAVDGIHSEGSLECGAPTAVIRAVCVSKKKGEQKTPVDRVELVPDLGIPGDAHAGNWHRQVSLLGTESVEKLRSKVPVPLPPGAFAENILCEGVCLYKLPVGTRLRIGSATAEVTQVGKECHADCAIRRTAGDCVMPREGIFVKILSAGSAAAGDLITVLP